MQYPRIYFLGDSTQGCLLDQEHQACPWAWGGPEQGSDDRGRCVTLWKVCDPGEGTLGRCWGP